MRFQSIQTNFTAGEISPRLLGRVDIARYQNGAKTMENYYVLAHGGANRWPGLQYIAAAKNANKKALLIPFVFSATQAYVLEFGDAYIRFYTGKAQMAGPLELVSPYAEADLPDVHYVQAADTMYLTHPNYYPRRLQRYGNTSWKLSTVPFLVEPHDEIGTQPATTLTIGALTGFGVTATASAAAFRNSDVGRYIQYGTGYAKIYSFTSTTVITINIVDDFTALSSTSGNWTILGTPQTTIALSVAGPLGAAITLTASADCWNDNPQITDVGRYVRANGGLVEIGAVTSALIATGIVRSILTSTASAAAGGWSLETKLWNSTNGYPRACTLHEQRLILAGTTAFPNTVWGSKIGTYTDFSDGIGDADGFAFDVYSEQQNVIQHIVSNTRLQNLGYGGEWTMRGGTEKPITPTNVQIKPDSSYGTGSVRPVRVGNEVLFMQRSGRKLRASNYDGVNDRYQAQDVTIISEHITDGGITQMAYAQEPDSIVGMVRTDGTLLGLTINRDQDVLGWSRRTTDGVIESVASIPYGVSDQMWVIVRRTVNGATVRYVEVMEFNTDPTQNRQTDANLIGSLATFTITGASWAAGVLSLTTSSAHGIAVGGFGRIAGMVPTAINGDVRAIAGTVGSTFCFNLEVDPGVATVFGTFGQLATTWAGFGHLEGKSVDIVGDGLVFPAATVTGGQVVLPRAVAAVEIGLHYTSTLEMLPPEIQTPGGTTQGNKTSINRIVARFYKTIGGTVQGQVLAFRRFGVGVLSKAVAPYTGDMDINDIGWGEAQTVTIVQDQPLPSQILAVIRKVTVTD